MAAETIKDTDDARVGNSPIRHAYRVLDDAEKARIDAIKDAGDAFLHLLRPKPTRESAIARTKIEEAVMWAVKGITA